MAGGLWEPFGAGLVNGKFEKASLSKCSWNLCPLLSHIWVLIGQISCPCMHWLLCNELFLLPNSAGRVNYRASQIIFCIVWDMHNCWWDCYIWALKTEFVTLCKEVNVSGDDFGCRHAVDMYFVSHLTCK